MNTLNPSRKLAAHTRADRLLSLLVLACLLASVAPLRAQNPPTYVFQWGSYGSGAGQFDYPRAIAVDSSNNAYVLDSGNNRVQKFGGNGNYLTQWGGNGTYSGQFSNPTGIAIDSNDNVFVADSSNDRVEKFDSNGNYLLQWGTYGVRNGQFNYPTGIAIDSSNDVYVFDNGNSRVQKFGDNGSYLTQWGSQGNGNGQFFSNQNYLGLNGIAIDSSNNVYVADNGSGRVQKFDRNGNYLTQWIPPGAYYYPTGVAIDSSNNVYVAGYNYNVYSGIIYYYGDVEEFDSSGNYLTRWDGQASGAGQFIYPEGMAVDRTGNLIYVADCYQDEIAVFVLNVTALPPIITQQPMNQTVPAGLNVTFNVGVVGAAPLACQWASNGIPLPGATNTTLTLGTVVLASSAGYSVMVSNSYGSVVSSYAVLTVLPAVATTLWPSATSTTGAVLQAKVTLGFDETLAWFEWGTDTNYGNIAGVTDIPGGAGTVTLTNTLNGLDGNLIYHYRVDAWNGFGIVYGNDMWCQVGFSPAVVNLFASSVTTNGATLNATVNPEGRNTIVLFRWGSDPDPTNVSAVFVGSGSAAVIANTPITGLTIGAVYPFSVIVSNSAGPNYSGISYFQALPWNWNLTAAPCQNWQSIASSADGNMLAAAPNGGQIVTSTNAGMTWNMNSPPAADWSSIASSADGAKLVAAAGYQAPGSIFISTNAGLFWTKTTAPLWWWTCVASSADGSRLAAVAPGAGICTSADGGATWTTNNAPAANWTSIASSADGNRLVATVYRGWIYTSTNAGGVWMTNNAPGGAWQSVASSADGTKLAAAIGTDIGVGVGPIYTSTNAGATWMKQTNAPLNDWFSIASSADGNKLVAVAYSNPNVYSVTNCIFTSTDAGVNWVPSYAPGTLWEGVASSADGNKLAAVANINGGDGGGTGLIYTMQTIPTPILTLTPSAGNLLLSWVVPSLSFGLQQNYDLTTTNWVEVTNAPALNLTNLQEQVLLPLPASNAFYWLKH